MSSKLKALESEENHITLLHVKAVRQNLQAIYQLKLNLIVMTDLESRGFLCRGLKPCDLLSIYTVIRVGLSLVPSVKVAMLDNY